jgi:glycosyltransferase involved in cell wall biosynthesis
VQKDSRQAPRVIHFVTGGFSGATQVAIDLCLAAQASQAMPVKLVLRKKRNTAALKIKALQDQGLDVEVVPGWSHLATILAFKRICQQWQPDILVAHGFSDHIWSRLAGLWAKVPLMVHVEHNSRERYTTWRLKLSLWLSTRTAAIVGVSEGVKSRLIELGFPEEKCMAISNGVAWDKFEASPTPFWSKRKPDVIMSSRFAKQKDQPTLIQAIRILQDQQVQTRLSLAGLGKSQLLRQSQKTAAQFGLQNQIDFLGHVSNLPELLSQHQIFVLSTHYEGMPLALIEAMASGCACIGTDVVGVREVIQHGVTGLLVPENNAQALANAIAMLLADREKAENLGRAARAAVQQSYTLQVMNENYTRLLFDLYRHNQASSLTSI